MKRYSPYILMLGLFAALVGCSPSSGAEEKQLPVIAKSFDLKDVKFSVLSKSVDGVGTLADVKKSYGASLLLATNGGIFEPNFEPSGLLVVDSVECSPINLKKGKGNFYLQPNGVFSIEAGVAKIAETTAYHTSKVTAELAIQSGPLLLAGGEIHKQLKEESTHRYTRNGIGLSSDGRVHIAYFHKRCSLYFMASYFKDELGCHSALYLDGAISGVLTKTHSMNLNREYASIIVLSSLK